MDQLNKVFDFCRENKTIMETVKSKQEKLSNKITEIQDEMQASFNQTKEEIKKRIDDLSKFTTS